MVNVRRFRDEKFGDLGVLELSELPFECRRVYWISKFVEREIRGNHAHRTLNQAIVVLRGKVTFSIFRGKSKVDISLSEEDDIFFIPPGTWRSFYQEESGSVLLVACDQAFDEKDYIRNWGEYLNWYSENYES